MQQFYALKTGDGACAGFMNQTQRDNWNPVEGITLVPFEAPNGASFDTICELAEAACAAP